MMYQGGETSSLAFYYSPCIGRLAGPPLYSGDSGGGNGYWRSSENDGIIGKLSMLCPE